ncbi:MAG: ABC transporter ATPase [Pedobacter sp.]|nr:ABC transporter ATPase [Pedobacter sp.]
MNFSPQSKIWIYQSDRAFNKEEVVAIEQKISEFASQWKAHGHQLQAKAEVLHNFFLVFTVDEATAGVTGCSIDASVRVVKEIEHQYKVDLFNRFNMAYLAEGKVVVASKEDFETLINIKAVRSETIVFNNMVQTLAEFENKWQVPFEQSWHNLVFAHLL